jgi:membrane protein involved in D-alanine export
MFWVDFHKLLLGDFVDTVGVSFAVIRVFMTCKHLVSSRKKIINEMLEWSFASAFYLPAIMVGPVFSGMDLRKEAHGLDEIKGKCSYLYRNLFWGLSLSIVFTSLFTEFANSENELMQLYAFNTTFLFLNLFAAFWGQSLIAEMSSRISGITIPSNFDKPWLARDIKDFWQRWHISMSKFIMQFIFFPLQINGINPKIATITAFVFMGLWHEVKIGYLLWGIAHGVLMSYWPERPSHAGPLRIWFERFLTFFIVINLSYIANYAFKG